MRSLAGGLRILSSLMIAAGLTMGMYLFVCIYIPFLAPHHEPSYLGLAVVFAVPLGVACTFGRFHRNADAGAGAAVLGVLEGIQGLFWMSVGASGLNRTPQGPFDGLAEVLTFYLGLVAVASGVVTFTGAQLSLIAARISKPDSSAAGLSSPRVS